MSQEDLILELHQKMIFLSESQIRTHTLVEQLSKKVDGMISTEDDRYHEFNDSRLKSAETVAAAKAVVDSMRERYEESATHCPNIAVKETIAKVKTQDWMMKAIFSATIIAFITAAVGTVNSCSNSDSIANASDDRYSVTEKSR